MGNHRAEPRPRGADVLTSQPVPGRRAAAVPVDSESPLVASGAPYVGRRVARVSAASLPQASQPETSALGFSQHAQVAVLERRPATEAAATGPLGTDPLDPATIERVLTSLEPVDHSTSFEHEATAQIPLQRAEAPRTTTAGKRRAVKHAGSRGPLFKGLPSAPVLLGIAALAVSVGGAVTVNDPGMASDDAGPVTQAASALTGSSGTGIVSKRAKLLSRESARDAQADAADTELLDAAEGLAEQRNSALAQLASEAEKRSALIAKDLWQYPLSSISLTARFGQYGLWSSYHTGLDFNGNTGDPIASVANGVVVSASYDGSYGNKTVVRLDDGTEIWYCHQNAFAVSVGDVVRGGDLIGYVGSTGNVTGSHLHLEVRPGGGDPVDPYSAMQQHGLF